LARVDNLIRGILDGKITQKNDLKDYRWFDTISQRMIDGGIQLLLDVAFTGGRLDQEKYNTITDEVGSTELFARPLDSLS